jgi:hypothetical protein
MTDKSFWIITILCILYVAVKLFLEIYAEIAIKKGMNREEAIEKYYLSRIKKRLFKKLNPFKKKAVTKSVTEENPVTAETEKSVITRRWRHG